MKKLPVNIIASIVSNKGYDDVFSMLYAMSDSCDKLYILCKESGTFTSERNIEVICPKAPLSGVKFWWWAFKKSQQLINDSNQKFIFIQLIAGVMSFLLKRKFGAKVLTGAYLVSAEFAYKKNEFWNADPNSKFMEPELIKAYKKQCKRKSFIHKISSFGNDFIIGNSQLVINDFVSKSFNKYVVAGNPLGNSWLRKLDLKEKSLDFIYAGNIQPPKGIETLLLAFKKLVDSGVTTNLTIVGEARSFERAWLKRISEPLQAYPITFTGKLPIDELQEYYMKSKIFVFPSFFEGSPRVVNEAICCDCAIISSNIPGAMAIDPQEELISFFNAGNVDELSLLMKDKLENYDAKSNFDFAVRFSCQNLAYQFMEVFQKEFKSHQF